MTRKDYILLAHALQGAYPIPENNTPHQAWVNVVEAIASELAKDNPRFDYQRFVKACGGLELDAA